eukprot:tig00021246_g19604.t1
MLSKPVVKPLAGFTANESAAVIFDVSPLSPLLDPSFAMGNPALTRFWFNITARLSVNIDELLGLPDGIVDVAIPIFRFCGCPANTLVPWTSVNITVKTARSFRPPVSVVSTSGALTLPIVSLLLDGSRSSGSQRLVGMSSSSQATFSISPVVWANDSVANCSWAVSLRSAPQTPLELSEADSTGLLRAANCSIFLLRPRLGLYDVALTVTDSRGFASVARSNFMVAPPLNTTISIKLSMDYDAFEAKYMNGSLVDLQEVLVRACNSTFQRSQIYDLSVSRGSVLIRFRLLRLPWPQYSQTDAELRAIVAGLQKPEARALISSVFGGAPVLAVSALEDEPTAETGQALPYIAKVTYLNTTSTLVVLVSSNAPLLRKRWTQLAGPVNLSAELAASESKQSAFDASVTFPYALAFGAYSFALSVYDTFNVETVLRFSITLSPDAPPAVVVEPPVATEDNSAAAVGKAVGAAMTAAAAFAAGDVPRACKRMTLELLQLQMQAQMRAGTWAEMAVAGRGTAAAKGTAAARERATMLEAPGEEEEEEAGQEAEEAPGEEEEDAPGDEEEEAPEEEEREAFDEAADAEGEDARRERRERSDSLAPSIGFGDAGADASASAGPAAGPGFGSAVSGMAAGAAALSAVTYALPDGSRRRRRSSLASASGVPPHGRRRSSVQSQDSVDIGAAAVATAKAASETGGAVAVSGTAAAASALVQQRRGWRQHVSFLASTTYVGGESTSEAQSAMGDALGWAMMKPTDAPWVQKSSSRTAAQKYADEFSTVIFWTAILFIFVWILRWLASALCRSVLKKWSDGRLPGLFRFPFLELCLVMIASPGMILHAARVLGAGDAGPAWGRPVAVIMLVSPPCTCPVHLSY